MACGRGLCWQPKTDWTLLCVNWLNFHFDVCQVTIKVFWGVFSCCFSKCWYLANCMETNWGQYDHKHNRWNQNACTFMILNEKFTQFNKKWLAQLVLLTMESGLNRPWHTLKSMNKHSWWIIRRSSQHAEQMQTNGPSRMDDQPVERNYSEASFRLHSCPAPGLTCATHSEKTHTHVF